MANNAKMYDVKTMIAAGMDPRTGLPIRNEGEKRPCLKKEIRKSLRVMDEQNAINRYTWYNLPKGLTGQLIERVLYYRGQGAFVKIGDTFYFLPYTLSAAKEKDGTGIDVYGRFTGISVLPFNGSTNELIPGKVYVPRYEVADLTEYTEKSPEEILSAIEETAVLLHDYSPQLSQTNIARKDLNEPILDVMSDCIPFMRTALLNSTGVMGVRVGNENEQPEVDRRSNAINDCALEGRKYTGIVGTLDFQELAGGNVAKAEEFMLALQSLDNYRLSLYGLDNGGLFQKKSHMLEAEQEMNAGNTGLVAEDGLRNRQEAAAIFNSYFGWDMWVEPSEATIGIDRDGDMVAGNDGPEATERKNTQQEASNDDVQ